jgi:HK97 family phage portal protein
MSLTRRALAGLESRSAGEWGNSVPPTNAEAGGFASAAGIPVSQESALQIAAVYGCVGLLSSSVATLPLRLMDNKVIKNANELSDSPLITEPYSEISLLDWVVQFVASLALRGEYFGQIISRDKKLFATQIKPIPADNASVRRTTGGTLEYKFFNKTVPIKDVFHVRMLSLPGMLRGVNPIEYLRLTLGLSLAQTGYGASYFRNSANPQGVIEVPGELDPTEAKKMARSWLAAHQGINQANLPAVLTDGSKFNPITITPEDSQFLESRGFSAGEISGMIYRVPPHMIGLVDRSTSWGTGVEQQEMGYTRNTLQDYIGRLQSSLTALHPPGQYVNLDLTQRLRGDTLQRAQASSFAVLGGFWTPNEARAHFDMPSRPDGDELNSPINTELLRAALAQAEQLEKEAKLPAQSPASSNGQGDPDLIAAPAH